MTDTELAMLLEGLDAGRRAWISGRMEWTATSVFDQSPDMSLFGPFGGEALGADPVRQARTAAQFHGGSGHCEVVKVILEGELAVVVLIEWNRVMFAGRTAPHPWVLRTTQVFRRGSAGHWSRLHRHADPLIVRRDLAETLALLERAPLAGSSPPPSSVGEADG